ncbi:MAG: methyltransferase domain-containing protein [Acidimicrobiales bacterium]
MASSGNSEDEPLGLDEAYAVETPDDNRRLYAKWAGSYDTDFIDANGYVYHENVVGIFLDAGGGAGGAVLDVGCGTGVVGVALGDLGEATVDGVDISREMLDVAATKTTCHGTAAYRNLIEADLTDHLGLADDMYSGIISVGTFTHGHLGPNALDELVRVAAPSAAAAIGINAQHYVERGFDRWFADRSAAGDITSPTLVSVTIYEAMDGEHAGDRANVAVFQVLR